MTATLTQLTEEERQVVLGAWLRSRHRGMAEDPWKATGLTPHPNQKVFTDALLAGKHDSIVHFGGARAGKSLAACLALLAMGYRYPGGRILMGRYTYRDLDRSTMVSMGEAVGLVFGREYKHVQDIDKDVGQWAAVRGVLLLRGGGQFEFQHFKDAGQLGSTEYMAAFVEEAQELPNREDESGESRVPEVITMIQSRLNRVMESERWGSSDPTLLLTAMGAGHNWVWDMGIGDPPARTMTLESNAEDNRENIPRAWFDRMRGLPESEQKRYLYLSHDEFAGRVFPEFTSGNVCPLFPIPKTWPMIRAHDPGVTGAGWVWLSTAVDTAALRKAGAYIPQGVKDGDIVTWDEFGPRDMPIEKQIEVVKGRDNKMKPVFTGIDPSDARQQTGRGLKTTKQLLKRHGIAPVRKAPADETAFILRAKQGFASQKLWVTDNCTTLRRQLTDEVWDENSKPGERKRKHASPFHVLSAWKYGLMLQPELLSAEATPVKRGRFRSRSRTGY